MDKKYYIHYRTNNNKKIYNINTKEIDANIISHTYEDYGLIIFDKQISKIGGAFNECRTLVSITIPDSVENFSRYAFWGCANLQEFNHKFSSIDKRCLINSKGVLIAFAPGNITEYIIPSNVTQIGGGVFKHSKLTKISIPKSVQVIGLCAFQNCETLCEVIMDFGIFEICQSAFANCKNLKHIVIPNSLIKVGDWAFVGCKSLSYFDSDLTTPDRRCLVIDGTLVAFATAGISDYTFPDEISAYKQTVFDYTKFKRFKKVLNTRNNINTLKNSITTSTDVSATSSDNITNKNVYSQILSTISKEEQDCKWVKPGVNITIQGFTLCRGNFYLGNYYKINNLPCDIKYTSKDKIILWATINPKLPILQDKFYKDFYFFSYYHLPPEGRHIYLSWLANLTPTQDVPDDILLLYICGIQLRMFLDADCVIEEKEDLINYLINLKSELSTKSRISYYIDEIIDISLAKFFFGKAFRFPLEKFNFFRTPLNSNKYLNSTIFSKDCINSDSIFEIYENLYPNSPLAKCKKYFTLFHEKNKRFCKFPRLGTNYKDVVQIPHNLPSYTHLNISKICNFQLFETDNYASDIIETIGKLFRKYEGDFLSFKQIYPYSVEQNSPLVYFSLPKYIAEKEIEIISNFKESLKTLEINRAKIVNFSTLAEIFGIKCDDDFLTRPVIRCILTGLSNIGYGIVPNIDVSYDKLINTKESCVLYKYPKSIRLRIDQEFKRTEILCKLLALIMQGTNVNEQELTAIYNNLSKLTNNKHNTTYLYAYFLWLSQRKNALDKGIRKALSALTKSQKSVILNVILNIVTTYDFINVDRISALNKILPYIDDNIESVHSLIHQAIADDNNYVPSGETDNISDESVGLMSEIKLDSNKLNKFKKQTKESHSLLSEIFSSDNEEDNSLNTHIGRNIMKQILETLVKQEVWEYRDFAELCQNNGVLLGSMLEQINDYAYEVVNDIVAEESEDKIYVTIEYKDKLV